MANSPYFWEDAEQASERLTRSYVLYGDNPVYVSSVEYDDDNDDVIANVRVYPDNSNQSISLSDEKFHRFRKLPPLGWFNCYNSRRALYLSRYPIRRIIHGLCTNNVKVGEIFKNLEVEYQSDYSFNDAVRDKGYFEACQGVFPKLDDVLEAIPKGSTAAVSNNYVVQKDGDGLLWLIRNKERVGLFPHNDSLLVFNRHKYLLEELEESPVLTVKDIKEF